MKKIRVLVVDDSPFVRKALQQMLSEDADIKVVGAAQSGKEALERVERLAPDVITLDVMMPEMDGLETLKILMDRSPVPVLMLSQFTKEGADLTMKALESGAMDFIDKSAPGAGDIYDLAVLVREKVKSIAGSKPVRIAPESSVLRTNIYRNLADVVAIGASTGGPLALHVLLTKFPRDIAFSILVVQHMPAGFTAPLAERINGSSQISVKEARDGDRLQPGVAYIAPAGLHMTVKRARHADGDTSRISLSMEPVGELHRPSINVLLSSVAKNYGERAIGVLLTGMGSDGARGLKAVRDAGGYTIAQDEETSAIFGMPKAAIELGAAQSVHPITSIAEVVLRHA